MPNISNARMRQLEKAEQKLKDLQDDKYVTPFVQEFSGNMALLMAQTPRDKWPEWVRTSFFWAEKKFPVGAAIYRERHKEVKE